MSLENLPAPIPHTPGPDADEARRLLMVAGFENMLNWSLIATGTLNELMIAMLNGQMPLGFNKFRTPNGRNCIIILGVGDDVVGLMTDVVHKLTGEENEDQDE